MKNNTDMKIVSLFLFIATPSPLCLLFAALFIYLMATDDDDSIGPSPVDV